jgi:hypothetical protein
MSILHHPFRDGPRLSHPALRFSALEIVIALGAALVAGMIGFAGGGLLVF